MDKEELLYCYFSGSLTEEQERHFERLLMEDVEFKKRYEFEKDLKRVTKEKRHKDLKSKLHQFETKINSKKNSEKSPLSFFKVAASIALLMTAGWLGYQSFFTVNYDNLYSENYNAYPNTVYTITRSDTINSKEREAFVAYEAGNYSVAIEKFHKGGSKNYFNFYIAQSYLGQKQFKEATHFFDTVIKNKEPFAAESHWYLALINLKAKEKSKALDYLRKLITDYEYKNLEARQLIKKLE